MILYLCLFVVFLLPYCENANLEFDWKKEELAWNAGRLLRFCLQNTRKQAIFKTLKFSIWPV